MITASTAKRSQSLARKLIKSKQIQLKRSLGVSSKVTMSNSSWTLDLSVKELKQLSATLDGAERCFEKSDLQQLVAKHYKSLEEARSQVSRTSDTLSRLKTILSQDRGVQNFEHYTPSDEHKERMNYLAEHAPDLFNNPTRTPRSTWFRHPRYHQNSQMPPYHVHFRQEMQGTLQYLYDTLSASQATNQLRALNSADRYFRGCMRGLNGHVSIEEYACFPCYKDNFPAIDIDFLYADHKELHRSEESVKKAFSTILDKADENYGDLIPKADILEIIQQVLDFDDQLMSHLGEEEELVVPLSLTDKDIYF